MTLNPLGKWLQLVHSCDCNDKIPYTHWIIDDKNNKLFKVCPLCEEKKMKEYSKKEKNDSI